jgi:hypothetical protein
VAGLGSGPVRNPQKGDGGGSIELPLPSPWPVPRMWIEPNQGSEENRLFEEGQGRVGSGLEFEPAMLRW